MRDYVDASSMPLAGLLIGLSEIAAVRAIFEVPGFQGTMIECPIVAFGLDRLRVE